MKFIRGAAGSVLNDLAPALTPPLATDGCFTLPLALCGWLLVEPALPQFGVEPGALNLPLEAAQCAIEAFVVLNGNFHRYHTPHRCENKN